MANPAPSLEHDAFLANLDLFVMKLPRVNPRLQAVRDDLYLAAKRLRVDTAIGHVVHCDAPTGSGKTVSLAALALRLARAYELEHILIVLPFLTLTRQTTGVLQAALEAALEGQHSVVESSSSAEYGSSAAKKSAKAWKLPVTVTTAAAFMDSLTSPNAKTRHARREQMRRSVVICDDADQWLRPELAPLLMEWIRALDSDGARFILSSATLPKFWEIPELVSEPMPVKTLSVDSDLLAKLDKRASIERLPKALSFDSVTKMVRTMDGPGMVVVNTIATAGRLAAFMRRELSGKEVLYISSSVAKSKKRLNEAKIKEAIKDQNSNIVLVATSAVEAGWDVSFAWAFREEAGLANLLQTAGRVNRSLEYRVGRPVYSFILTDQAATNHQGLQTQQLVLSELFRKKMVSADGCTEATRLQMSLDPKIASNAHALLHAHRIEDWKFLASKSKPYYYPKSSMFLPPSSFLPEGLQAALNAAKKKTLADTVTGAEFHDFAITLKPTMPEKHPDHFERVLINGAEWFEVQGQYYDLELGYTGDNDPA